MKRDLMNHLHPVVAIAPQVATDATAITSLVIDTAGYGAACFIIALGTAAAATITGTVLLEESDNSDFSASNAVADEQMNGTEALAGFVADDDLVCKKIGYVGSKRYIRMTVTPTSNDDNLPISAIAVLGMAESQPTDNPPE